MENLEVLKAKAKAFDELIAIFDKDNGITPCNYNGALRCAKANKEEWSASYNIIKVMEAKQVMFQDIYKLVLNCYKNLK